MLPATAFPELTPGDPGPHCHGVRRSRRGDHEGGESEGTAGGFRGPPLEQVPGGLKRSLS